MNDKDTSLTENVALVSVNYTSVIGGKMMMVVLNAIINIVKC
jgi:hypothetical protein